ncbi:MAG: Brp/Blh family beta-carotene 15,15'-dioxygenase [Pacificimonas sp.]
MAVVSVKAATSPIRPFGVAAYRKPAARGLVPPFLAIVVMTVLYVLEITTPTFVAALTVLMFLAGIPHGAAEHDAATGHARIPSLPYISLYMVVGTGLFLLFLVAPLPGAVGFIALSALHFSRAEYRRHRALGVFATVAAFLFSPERTADIIAGIAGDAVAPAVFMAAGAIAAAAALCVIVIELSRRPDPVGIARLAATILAFAILPPLTAMAVYFLILHSAKAYTDPVRAGQTPRDAVIAFSTIGGPAVLIGLLTMWVWTTGALSTAIVAAAALAFAMPHMMFDLTGHWAGGWRAAISRRRRRDI